MRRRAFLASAGIAALAGCSNGDGSTTATPTPTETGAPNFELRGARFPGNKTLNVVTNFIIAVENTGSAAGTFRSPLQMKVGDGEWKTAGEVEMPLDAGETGEWHSPDFLPQYLTTLHFRLGAFDETWSIKIHPRELDFSHYYAVPTGLYINVLGGSFESTYSTSGNETADTTNDTATPAATTTPVSAPDEKAWAVMQVDVRNRLEEPHDAPPASSFVLEVDGEQMPQHQEVSANPYEGGELAGRTVRRGELVYAVPEGTRARDIRLVWEASLPKGDVKAIWTK
ncbi:hypothetical protein [Haloplanus aerogenes]|uniref:DUF4352 domain-containing protein n=1 Tax=Haloplanus aerogenes TaxID=660522 RepID=A0A3M0CYK5_9EURY|nr:hypothetical protein [Haloplanus aerogenes]AZH26499.1 hypothetical protein DU502_14465 [Haloplanus aerogenes]RMB12726.1 hypothetical protein ATH50_2876 [Haloplanus aerogenes]